MSEDKDWSVGALKAKEVGNALPEVLSQMAKDIVSNVVFTDRHIRECDKEHLLMIFMPLMFGALADKSEEYINDIGMFWAPMKDAGPTSMNGYPLFFTVGFFSKHDTAIIWEKVAKLEKMMAEV